MPHLPDTMRLLLLAALLSLLPSHAGAGAWTREAGGWFASLRMDRWATEERYDSAGHRVPYIATVPGQDDMDRYRNQALRGYLEYGVTAEWTAIVGGAFEWLESRANGDRQRNAGFSDLGLGVKRRLVARPLIVAVQVETRIPTGYDTADSPALGPGKVDVSGRLLAGAATARLYASAETGFTLRGGEHADEIPYALELGVTLTDELLVRGELRGAATVRAPRGGGSFDPALADSRSHAAGVSLVLRGKPLELVFGAEHVLAGRNTLAGTRYSLAIWSQR